MDVNSIIIDRCNSFLLPDPVLPSNILNSDIKINENPFWSFLIGETISFGALRIALDSCSKDYSYLKDISFLLPNQILSVDLDLVETEESRLLFKPFLEELNLEIQIDGSQISYISTYSPSDVPNEIIATIIRLYSPLRKFLLAIKYKLCLDIDIFAVKKDLDSLYNFSNNTHAKQIFWGLIQIMSSYQPHNFRLIELSRNIRGQQLEIFQKLSNNVKYHQLSQIIYNLGYNNLSQKVLVDLEILSEDLIHSISLDGLLTISSKSIFLNQRTFNQPPLVIYNLLSSEFLPPIVPMHKAIQDALENWISMYPSSVLS
jgi:hypothetical protein